MSYLNYVCNTVRYGNWVTDRMFPIVGCETGSIQQDGYQQLTLQIMQAGKIEKRVHEVYVGNRKPVVHTDEALSVTIRQSRQHHTIEVARKISDSFYSIFSWFNRIPNADLTLLPQGPQPLIYSECGTADSAEETTAAHPVNLLYTGNAGQLFLETNRWSIYELGSCGATHFVVKTPRAEIAHNSMTIFDGDRPVFELQVTKKQ